MKDSYNNLKHHLKNFFFEEKHIGSNKYQKSYSQCGEDLIIKFIFSQLNLKPNYIDIGAHHPFIISNTAIFYIEGINGINIEPNPDLFQIFKKERTRDINLNFGISEKEAILEYYQFSEPALNTFSEHERDNCINEKKKFIGKKNVQTFPLKHVINKYCNGKFPNFLSLDVEGFDSMILNQIDFKDNYPTVVCVETISYSTNREGKKNDEIIKLLKTNGYFLYADTYLNSIFIHEKTWKSK